MMTRRQANVGILPSASMTEQLPSLHHSIAETSVLRPDPCRSIHWRLPRQPSSSHQRPC